MLENLTEYEILELDSLLTQRRAYELKESLFEFVKEFWNVIVTNEYIHNWHIEFLCDEVQIVLEWVIKGQVKLYDLIVNIPPGTSKSTIISRMAPAWLWANDSSKTIISNTIDSKNATEFSTSTKDLIQSEKYQLYFPEVKIRRDVSAKTFYQSRKGGKRFSLTTRGSSTGKHGDVLIDDDPMDYTTAQSPIEAKRCIEGFKALQTRKKDKEKVPYILVMQRLSKKDTTAHALKVLSDVRHLCLPAEDKYNNIKPEEIRKFYIDGMLDPKRLSREILDKQRKGLLDDTKPISDIAFDIQFNQASLSDDSLLYPKINMVNHLPANREGVLRYSFTDVADTGKDYLCTWFIEVNEGRIYVYDCIYTQQGSAVTIPLLKLKIEQNNSMINKIETNNQGSVFVSVLLGQGVNVSGYYSSGNKEEKISAYAPFMSYYYFVEPRVDQQEYKQALKHLESYPKEGKAEDGHDDAEDSWTESSRYLYTNARYLFTQNQ